MAYADQQMSGSKITALIIVALIHILLGYALVTGLAYSAVKNVMKKVTAVDIKEPEKPKDTPPPPKPSAAPPPPVAPPPQISIAVTPPQIETVQVAPPPAPPVLVAAPPAPVVAPPPPPPRVQPKSPAPKGNPGNWATSNDYPSQALREEREGTTRFRVSVSADGRVTDCQVTGSSGSPDLDAVACQKITQRARFNPATDGEGQPTTGTYSNAVRWVIPKD